MKLTFDRDAHFAYDTQILDDAFSRNGRNTYSTKLTSSISDVLVRPMGPQPGGRLFLLFASTQNDKDILLNMLRDFTSVHGHGKACILQLPHAKVRLEGGERTLGAVKGPISALEGLVYGQGRFSFVNDILLPNIQHIGVLRGLVLTGKDMCAFLKISPADLAGLSIRLTCIDARSNFKKFSLVHRAHYTILGAILETQIKPIDIALHIFNDTSIFDVHPNLPFSQMTAINLKGYPLKWHHLFEHILRPSALSLVRGSFDIVFDRCFHPKNIPKFGNPTEMMALKVFKLRLYNPSQNPAFLDNLITPNLSILRLDVTDIWKVYSFQWDLRPYIRHVQRCSQTLEMFALNHMDNESVRIPEAVKRDKRSRTHRDDAGVGPLAVEDLLRALPYVKELMLPLGIVLSECGSGVLNQIATGELLPRLKALKAEGNEKDMVMMTQMRNKIGVVAPRGSKDVIEMLRTLVLLYISGDFIGENTAARRQYKVEGCDVSIVILNA